MVNRRDSETRDESQAARRERLRVLAARPATWLALTAVVALIDYSAGRHIHPGLLYLLPVGLAAWYAAALGFGLSALGLHPPAESREPKAGARHHAAGRAAAGGGGAVGRAPSGGSRVWSGV